MRKPTRKGIGPPSRGRKPPTTRRGGPRQGLRLQTGDLMAMDRIYRDRGLDLDELQSLDPEGAARETAERPSPRGPAPPDVT